MAGTTSSAACWKSAPAAAIRRRCSATWRARCTASNLKGLHDKARDNLRHFRVPNLHLLFGDGMVGFARGAPYAAIIAAAGGEDIPSAWVDQLAVGGRLVAPAVTVQGRQNLVVVDKTPTGLVRTELEAVHFVPLKSGIA